MRIESAIAPWQSGDGRVWEVNWPELNEWQVAATFLNVSMRHAFANVAMWTSGGSSTIIFTTRNNIPCAQWTSTVATGTKTTLFANDWGPRGRLLMPALGGGYPSALNDRSYFRYYANVAYDVPPSANADCNLGFVCSPNGAGNANGVFLDGLTDAFEWTITPAGAAAFCVRATGGVGLTTFPVPAPFDITDFHCYEIRIVQASIGQQGTVQALIDGRPFQSLPYGGGTVLPPPNATQPVYVPFFCNNGGNSMNVYIQRISMSYAPTAPNLQ